MTTRTASDEKRDPMRCEDWDVAVVRRIDLDTIEWVETPPQTHVADDLIDTPKAREALAERYEVREPCPRQPGVQHAYRVDTGGGS